MEILDPGHPDRPVLLGHIEQLIRTHHSLYEHSRVKADQWEELLTKALIQTGFPCQWQAGSHAVGTDVTLASGATVSVKSGTHDTAKSALVFSGSRLGRHSHSINAMVNYLNATRSNYYALAATPKPATSGTIEYHIFLIPGRLIHYGQGHEWGEKASNASAPIWEYANPNLSAEIRASMSHQVWTTLDLSAMRQAPAHTFTI